ncbi:uncharacterized protein HKW66_Vig0006440 [Vigna angularis]|uniref:F-box associated domain-containing protein n=1 Tax=Phaseolus angularis TaxID=3914 RepID=A0A8T0LCP4_PHAAN|nr:uncharacterized protein HKW66_Vig0006440 [Vigna angularis]
MWTPNENVCIGETLYWVTSARAYSVVGYDVGRNGWRELGVPMTEKGWLEVVAWFWHGGLQKCWLGMEDSRH